MSDITTLKTFSSRDVVCFSLDIHLWSARTQLRTEDLQKFSSSIRELPDSEVASMGSVKLIDPECIRVFERLKREAQLLLETRGLPLFGVRAVPADKYEEVCDALTVIKQKFDAQAKELLMTYDQKVKEWELLWRTKKPEYMHLFDRAPKAETVYGRLSFEFHAYRVEPPKEVADGQQEFSTKLSGLKGELYQDAAREATQLLDEYLMKEDGSKREYITPKTLGPFKRMATRFRDFSFIDPSATAAAELIETTVDQALAYASTNRNRISDGPMMLVWSMASVFANPVTALALAERANANGKDGAIDDLLKLGNVEAKVTTEPKPQTQQTVAQFDAQSKETPAVQIQKLASTEVSSGFDEFESSLQAMALAAKASTRTELIELAPKPLTTPVQAMPEQLVEQKTSGVVTGLAALSLF